MTWGEVKLAALQRIFSNDGTALNKDDSNEEYLNAMPAVANEALTILTGVGVPLLGRLNVVVTPDVSEPEKDGDTLRVPVTPNGLARIDMRETAERYRALVSGEIYLGVPREVAELVPLYIGAELYREDDIQMSTQMLNEFEAGLSRLQMASAARPAGGSGSVKNTSNWW